MRTKEIVSRRYSKNCSNLYSRLHGNSWIQKLAVRSWIICILKYS